MNFETILYTVEKGVATITLNRPDTLNAFNDTMILETTKAVKSAGRDVEVRCIVLTGNGRGFSSGQDLKDLEGREAGATIGDHLRHTYHNLIEALTTVEKPVIGSINGVAAGAGCSVALATDLRIASEKASFLQAFSRIGLVPDSGSTWFLPQLIGYARAYEMAVLAEKVPAKTALEWGLINKVVPHEQLAEMTMEWALQIAQGPTKSYGMTKRAMRRAMVGTLPEAMAFEATLQDIASATEDAREGVVAFVEKRKPNYTGN
jgi:2-(1,2-epoxy-1,2-dihydrophenyl)acetyl-CoA isomerase